MDTTIQSTFAERAARNANSPRAKTASANKGNLEVVLATGATIVFPANILRPLAALTDEQLREVRVLAGGTTLMWRSANIDISVEGMLQALTGLPTHIEVARKGGSARTPAKAAAARANGKKGGRPRKMVPTETPTN